MATIQHRSYDKTVANIPERNAISPRRPGMTVLVRDAIGDPYAGSGRAVYRWDEVQASWILMFKDNVETLTFTGESKTISQDQIQLSFVPANGQVWDVMVRDGLVAHQVEHSVAGSVVTIQPDTPGQFDGKQLSVRYAYGTMTQQLDLEIARVVGEAVGAFDKEALGLGNVDNTSDLNKPLSTAAQTALAGKSDTGHTHAEVTTSVAGFMSAADKTKLDGVETGANAYTHPANHPASIITQDADNRFVSDTEKATWNGKEPAVTAGTTAQYWRGDKTWRDLFTDVRAATLTGLSTATNAVVSATDTVLGALGKLQKQVSDNLTTLTSHTGNTSNPHSVTKAQVGLGNVDNTSDASKPISTAVQTALNAKQDTLVSGTNIKTLNGESLLGAGNLVLQLAADQPSAVTYAYDASGRVETTTETLPTGTRTTTVTYNEAGQVKTVTVTLGNSTRTVQYAYDQYGVLTGTTSTES